MYILMLEEKNTETGWEKTAHGPFKNVHTAETYRDTIEKTSLFAFNSSIIKLETPNVMEITTKDWMKQFS